MRKPLFILKKPLFVLDREREYYWGLALLAASCLTLVWALWRDAFKPEVFLAGLLVFSWGYALLWRNDLQQRLAAMEEEAGDLRAELWMVRARILPPRVPELKKRRWRLNGQRRKYTPGLR